MRHVLIAACETFVLAAFAFVVHRALAHPYLASFDLESLALFQALLVGIMSDVWMAALLALGCLLAGSLVAWCGRHRWVTFIQIAIALLMALGLAGHQAYVAFYRFQIVPFHLRYLFDGDFLAANGSSLLQWRTALIFLATSVAAWSLARGKIFAGLSTQRLAAVLIALLAVATILHNRNIRYKVQWFIPETLQLNVLERLYVNWQTMRLPPTPTSEELAFLAARQGKEPPRRDEPLAAVLQRLTSWPVPRLDQLDDLGQELVHAFRQRRASGRKPVVLIVLMESQRPAETGALGAAATLTPQLDAIASSSIVFRNAYATGSVTRGAQEAVFCGYPGSRDTSLMRGQALTSVVCLPELARRQGVESAWLHGGEGRFDGQARFWREHGVSHIMTRADFPPSAAGTGWGIGDRSFLPAAHRALVALRKQTPAEAVLAMMLTVTNHIPWTLPADAPADLIKLAPSLAHPSYATTAYADRALGEFWAALREESFWNDSLVIIASDHGNAVPAYHDTYQDAAPERRQAHINLVVAGGLVEQVLLARKIPALVREELVSQAGVAAYLATLFGSDSASLGAESLFLRSPRASVIADLEQGVFVPASGTLFSRRDIVDKASRELADEQRAALLQFRSFLHASSGLAFGK